MDYEYLLKSALVLLAIICVTLLLLVSLTKLIFKNLDDEKLRMYLDFSKWAVASVSLVIIANIMDSFFKDREAGINEIKQYDNYVQMVVTNDRIGQRWRLAQYFSTVTVSKSLRSRWIAYYELVEPEYQDSLKKLERLQDTLQKLMNIPTAKSDSNQRTKLEAVKQQIKNLNGELNPKINKPDEAVTWEQQGLNYLLEKKVNAAIDAFSAAEKAYPSLHNNYEILNLLIRNQGQLTPENEQKWKDIYLEIISNYAWQMDPQTRAKMNALAR